MSIIQLNPPLPLITPKGAGLSHFIINYGLEFELVFVVFISATGECCSFSSSEIRAQKNTTIGRDMVLNDINIENGYNDEISSTSSEEIQ